MLVIVGSHSVPCVPHRVQVACQAQHEYAAATDCTPCVTQNLTRSHMPCGSQVQLFHSIDVRMASACDCGNQLQKLTDNHALCLV